MKIKNLTKKYGNKKVLDIAEFEFKRDMIYAVIGPNGSGKSTLAKIIAGIEKPDDLSSLEIGKDELVGYLPQKAYAFNMSVMKNISLACHNKSDRSGAVEMLDRLDIGELASNKAGRLSGGETAKMALVRLLVGKHDILILDEPTAAMDVQSTLSAEKLICDYCHKNHCTVILITHSLTQAKRVSDEVLFLVDGVLTEMGPSSEVLTDPKTDQLKQFLEFYGI